MTYAFDWDMENSVVRYFLECDVDNLKGIKLYGGWGIEESQRGVRF